MKIWECWRIRRRIPRWIRGECSYSEAVAEHVGACAACAAEAVLAAALTDAAAGSGARPAAARREATWARVEQALSAEASPPAVRKGGARWRRCRLGVVAAALGLALSLGGQWWNRRMAPAPTPMPRLNVSLWEPEQGIDDPMGPMTERLLALMEHKK